MKVHSRVAIVALSLNLLMPTVVLAQDGFHTPSPSPSPSVEKTPEVHSSSETPRPEGSTSGRQTSVQERSEKFCTNVLVL